MVNIARVRVLKKNVNLYRRKLAFTLTRNNYEIILYRRKIKKTSYIMSKKKIDLLI